MHGHHNDEGDGERLRRHRHSSAKGDADKTATITQFDGYCRRDSSAPWRRTFTRANAQSIVVRQPGYGVQDTSRDTNARGTFGDDPRLCVPGSPRRWRLLQTLLGPTPEDRHAGARTASPGRPGAPAKDRGRGLGQRADPQLPFRQTALHPPDGRASLPELRRRGQRRLLGRGGQRPRYPRQRAVQQSGDHPGPELP